ncbi:MAG: hypothetical protein IJW53_05015 [Clostridia bacterium]|nr:hypothetical protein [Clostridia bacterium]
MKKVFLIIGFVVFLVVLFTSILNAFVKTDSSKEQIPNLVLTEITDQERLNRFYENVSVKISTIQPVKSVIESFDVNENGMIALLHPSYLGVRYIRIISSDGTFQKAFTYKNNTSVAVRWVGDDLQIFNVRGGHAFTIDMDANILGVYDIKEDEGWNAYLHDVLKTDEKKIGDTTYSVRKDHGKISSFAQNSSKLVVTTDADEKVIYDVSVKGYANAVFGIGFFVLFFVLAIVVAIIIFRKYSKY